MQPGAQMPLSDLKQLLDESDDEPLSDEVSAKKRVLIVDDDPAVRESLTFLLRDAFDVVVAVDAKTGVAAMTPSIAVVVLDVKMQGHDGFWACEQIQAIYPNVPVIFHSAYQDLKNPYEIINRHRPFAYLTKGEGTREMTATVARAARIHEQLVENQATIRRLREAQGKKAAGAQKA
jgi:DNA-binding NtrC family response regulator